MAQGTVGPAVSVCIPAYNEERNIAQLLRFLRDCTALIPNIAEILVDVSGSTDGTRALVRNAATEWPVVRAIDSGHRDGLLKALDRLIGESKGDIVVRMDADVVLSPGALAQLVAALADPTVGIVGGRICPARGRSRWVNLVSDAEWEVHHQVCLLRPKTTVVQAFRPKFLRLPSDSGLEDAALQDCIESSGYRAAYVADAEVQIMPPSTVRGMLSQRVRTDLHTRNHIQEGYPVPSTASVRTVSGALINAVKQRRTSLFGLALFLGSELSVRLFANLRSRFAATAAFRWDPIEGTKDLDWAVGSSMVLMTRGRSAASPERFHPGFGEEPAHRQ